MAGSRRPRPPNRGARKTRRWFHARAVARPRAHKGRRRGQARSASHRRNPGQGLPPASKYSASNHPPKAQALCQAFDIDHVLYFVKYEASGTIKRFWAKGKWLGGEKMGLPAMLRCEAERGSKDSRPPQVKGKSSPRSLHVIASEAKQSILSLCRKMDCFASLAMTAGQPFAFSQRIA